MGKGRYVNTVSIMVSNYEITLDFSFRTALPRGPNMRPEFGRNSHVARMIMSSKAAEEMRDLLIQSLPGGSQ